MNDSVTAYLRDLDAFFYGGNDWQPALMELLNDISNEQAAWRPAEGRHTIYEIVLHINFWKESVIATLNGKPLSSAQRIAGSWRFTDKKISKATWEKCRNDTVKAHEKLKKTLSKKLTEMSDVTSELTNYTREVINHDSYHAGQIGLIRAMLGGKLII